MSLFRDVVIGLWNVGSSKLCLVQQTDARPTILVRTVERANQSATTINAHVQPGTKEDTVNKVALSTECCFYCLDR